MRCEILILQHIAFKWIKAISSAGFRFKKNIKPVFAVGKFT
jgi:hypothetical protein